MELCIHRESLRWVTSFTEVAMHNFSIHLGKDQFNLGSNQYTEPPPPPHFMLIQCLSDYLNWLKI